MKRSNFDVSTKFPSVEEDFYYSKDGLIIFTEKYHENRGYCCESNCKHCPYGFSK